MSFVPRLEVAAKMLNSVFPTPPPQGVSASEPLGTGQAHFQDAECQNQDLGLRLREGKILDD